MANDISYSQMDYVLPPRIPGFSANLAILNWFIQHGRAENGWITFSILTKSDGELTSLKAIYQPLGN